MTDKKNINIKYLITSEQDLQWGLTVNTVGMQHIERGMAYPPRNHPTRYLFSTEKGRILEEFQLIYIIKGQGFITTTEISNIRVSEGQMFLLFPGQWHSYHPDHRSGWTEYWIGFNGNQIEKYTNSGFFRQQQPIYNIGIQDEIVHLYRTAILIAKEQKAGYQQMLAGIVNMVLGYAYAYDKQSSFENMQVIHQINKAKIIMADSYDVDISPKEIASKVNMSYSWFRHIFKEYTGIAPIRYIQELRINKSKELLTNTSLPIKEIAFETGFNKVEYFYSIFKKRTGYTPDKYREFTQGRNL